MQPTVEIRRVFPERPSRVSPGRDKKSDISWANSMPPPVDPFEQARLRRQKRPITMLRSEPMVMLQMIVQADSASETVEELGEMGCVMFCDLNEGATAFKRNFVQQMKDCDEVDRCLRFIGDQVCC